MVPLSRLQKVSAILLVLLILVGGGSLGYHWIEGWNVIESLYMVVITLATVGYTEVHPLSPQGRIFTMILIVAGVSLVTFTLGTLTRMIFEGEIQTLLGRRRAMTKIRNLKDHYII